MLPKPKEILPTVIGTVVTLTALVAVVSPKPLSSVAGSQSAAKPKVCCASPEVQAKCSPAVQTTTPS